ncbi:MAG: hypothetical protein ABII71_01175 [Candidatus Micrarchaeota archaeon]
MATNHQTKQNGESVDKRRPVMVRLGGLLGKKKEVAEILESPDMLTSVKDIVRALNAASTAEQFGAMLLAAERRIGDAESCHKAAIGLIEIAATKVNSERSRVIDLFAAAYAKLPEKKRAKVDRVVSNTLAALCNGMRLEGHSLVQKPNENSVYVLAGAVEEASKIRFSGNSSIEEGETDKKTLEMLLRAVFAQWVVDDGESGMLSPQTRQACARALWEAGEYRKPYWAKMVNDMDTELAKYASACMLSLRRGDDNGWDLLEEQIAGGGHDIRAIRVAMNIASIEDENARDFTLTHLEDGKNQGAMLAGMAEAVEKRRRRVPRDIADAVDGLLEREPLKKNALRVLRGGPRPSEESNAYRLALGGDIEVARFIIEMRPERIDDVLAEGKGVYEAAADGDLGAMYLMEDRPGTLLKLLGKQYGTFRKAKDGDTHALVIYAEHKRDDLDVLLGPKSVSFKEAAGGSEKYIETYAQLKHGFLRGVLRQMRRDGLEVMVDNDQGQLRVKRGRIDPAKGTKMAPGWEVWSKELLGDRRIGVRKASLEFLLEAQASETWSVAARNVEMVKISDTMAALQSRLAAEGTQLRENAKSAKGNTADDLNAKAEAKEKKSGKMDMARFLRWAVSDGRETDIRRRAFAYLRDAPEIRPSIYLKVAAEAGREDATEETVKMSLRIIQERKMKLTDEQVQPILEAIEKNKHGLAIDALFAVHAAGHTAPLKHVKETVLDLNPENTPEVRRDLQDMVHALPELAPPLGNDRDVIEHIRGLRMHIPEAYYFALAGFAVKGMDLARDEADLVIDDARYVLCEKEELNRNQVASAFTAVYIMAKRGYQAAKDMMWDEAIPALDRLSMEEETLSNTAKGILADILPEIKEMAETADNKKWKSLAEGLMEDIEEALEEFVRMGSPQEAMIGIQRLKEYYGRDIKAEIGKERKNPVDSDIDGDMSAPDEGETVPAAGPQVRAHHLGYGGPNKIDTRGGLLESIMGAAASGQVESEIMVPQEFVDALEKELGRQPTVGEVLGAVRIFIGANARSPKKD